MKYKLKLLVNVKLQGVEKFKLDHVLYVLQAVKNLLSLSRLMEKGGTMDSMKDNMTMSKNFISVNLNSIKG